MKLFTKLALVSAIAVSGQAMAMQSLDDSALSAATGQDGIDLTIKTSGISIEKLLIHDNDGLDSGATTNGGLALHGTGVAGDAVASEAAGAQGAIVVNGITLGVSATAANPLFGGALAKISIDTDGNGGDAFLNVNAKTNGIDLHVDDVSVAQSNAVSTMTGARRGAGTETKILENLDVTVGATELNIQLGHAPQGAMIVANGTIVGGITIGNLDLVDASTTGKINIGGMKITSAGLADLNVNTKISVLPTAMSGGGLAISSTGAQDIYINSIALGNNKSIGSVEIQGMDMGTNTILVSGH